MSYLLSLMAREDYHDYIDSEREKVKTASDLGLEECQKCGHCCMIRPCIPTPKELTKIAEYLGLNLRDCVQRYFVADRLGNRDTPYLFPAKDTQMHLAGKYLTWQQGFDRGYCNFYDKTKKICRIWEVRPRIAREVACWHTHGDADSDLLLGEVLEEWEGFDFKSLGIDIDEL